MSDKKTEKVTLVSWRNFAMISGAIGATMGIMVAWMQLELPRVAFYSEVASVEQFGMSTRIIVLYQQKKQATRDLEIIKSRLMRSRGNADLIRAKADLETEIEEITHQLRTLNQENSRRR